MAEIYQIIESESTVLLVSESSDSSVLLVSETIENAIYIATERNGQDGADGIGSVTYSANLGSVTTVTITEATHEVPVVRNVTLFDTSGNAVSVAYNIVNNDVIIESNVNLLNHSIKIY